jgi:biotin-dependent carboxylase-like uncharacterized protein
VTSPGASATPSRQVAVLRTGPQALVTDLGRPGYAHLGVPPSGTLDPGALRLANRLVGNPEGAAGLEVLLGGLELQAGAACTVAVTGPAAALDVDGAAADSHVPVHLGAGAVLRLGAPMLGLRNWVAISGGIAVDAELGSRATDLLSGLGPDPLRDGDILPLGPPSGLPVGVDVVVPTAVDDPLTVPVLLGPRDGWIEDAARRLADTSWTVTASSNRIGLRLDGEPLRKLGDTELPSEPVVTGAVQVPANGLPVVFLADHPVTGGYPVVAVVLPAALPALAQARPGSTMWLQPAAAAARRSRR